MTFQQSTWAVDGNQIDASLMRLMNQAASGNTQGVSNPLDCIVSANSPATAGIIIGPGGVVILGTEAAYQGSYTGWNIGTDTTLSIASTGGTPRSDMVIIRAEDPTWAGSPWGGSPAGQIIFPRVISNVGSSATTVPGGNGSAIPLCRIDMPASATVVQQSYIHDLRQVANPQASMLLYSVNGPNTPVNSTISVGTTVQWPTGASWSVPIPSYATSVVLTWAVYEVTNNGEGDGWARALVWPIFGPTVTSPNLSTPQSMMSIAASNAAGKHSFGGGGTVAVPASIRGTTQTLQFAQTPGSPNHTATMGFNDGSTASILLRFAGLASLS